MNQLRITEQDTDGPFECSYCKRKVTDPVCYVASIVEPAGNVVVDGRYCCELCAESDCQSVDVVDARKARECVEAFKPLYVAAMRTLAKLDQSTASPAEASR